VDRLAVVSIIRGPRVAIAQMTDPAALIKINGNYLRLDRKGFLTLARLVADDIPEGIGSGEGPRQQPEYIV